MNGKDDMGRQGLNVLGLGLSVIALISVIAGVLCKIPTEADVIQIDSDPNSVLDIAEVDVASYADLVICTTNGAELILTIGEDKLEITGDADMNEAARIFFNEMLKPMADDYIEEQIRSRAIGE